ncbi:hypothetical protein D3C79_966800 [compost metagenome]
MVPDSECRMPTLMVSAAWMLQLRPIAAMDALRVKALIRLRRFIVLSPLSSNVRVRQMATSGESFSKGCAGTVDGSGTGIEGRGGEYLHRPGAERGRRCSRLRRAGAQPAEGQFCCAANCWRLRRTN